MEFKKMYEEKLVTAEQAAAVVKSGDWVDYGWTTGTPVAVDHALAKRLPELTDVNFRGGILTRVCHFIQYNIIKFFLILQGFPCFFNTHMI